MCGSVLGGGYVVYAVGMSRAVGVLYALGVWYILWGCYWYVTYALGMLYVCMFMCMCCGYVVYTLCVYVFCRYVIYAMIM